MDSVVSERTVQAEAYASGDIASRVTETLSVVPPESVLRLLPERDLRNLLGQSTIRTLPKQRVLFRTGDAGRSAVLVLKGYVKLSTHAANGRELVLEIAEPGTIFGEIAVLSGAPRKADATCLTACRVLAMDGGAFRHALERTPVAMFAAMQMLIGRLSSTTTREIDAVSLPAAARLAKALLHLADMHSQRVDGGVHIGFRLSQRELGAMTGLIRESINKHLKAWRAAGWVELSGNAVTLRDECALREFVRDNEAR